MFDIEIDLLVKEHAEDGLSLVRGEVHLSRGGSYAGHDRIYVHFMLKALRECMHSTLLDVALTSICDSSSELLRGNEIIALRSHLGTD